MNIQIIPTAQYLQIEGNVTRQSKRQEENSTVRYLKGLTNQKKGTSHKYMEIAHS